MNIQEAYNKLSAQGGGILPLTHKKYILEKPLNIHTNNVRIIGQGSNKSILEISGDNAIELTTNQSALMLEGVKVVTLNPQPKKGIGIYVYPKLTVDVNIVDCQFETVLNSIYYRNQPDKTSLGNIVIRNSRFPQACTKTPREYYYEGLPHKVMLWGAKTADKKLEIVYNQFSKHPHQRQGAIELCIWGDPSTGKGNGPYTLREGIVAHNIFNGATRECLAISDHQKFVIAFNTINDSKRVGIYAIRGYRSIIHSNVVKGALFRGHRLAHLRECVWTRNEVYNSGAKDNTKVGVGGMHISFSHNNTITHNTIQATKGHAVAINNGSSGNYIAHNQILGNQSVVFVAKDSQTNQHDWDDIVLES